MRAQKYIAQTFCNEVGVSTAVAEWVKPSDSTLADQGMHIQNNLRSIAQANFFKDFFGYEVAISAKNTCT